MHRLAIAGAVLTGIALVGYAVGTATPYPGRSFTVTGVMAGLALLLIGRAMAGEGTEG